MWIVRIALHRPYTFIVLALLILILGVITLLRTATDIFPNINIPVVGVVWNYTGLPPQDMANRIVGFTERVAQTTVNDIAHTESTSLNGIAVVKYFFQPHVNESLAVSQISAVSQALLRQLPPGTTPPFILPYSASTVSVLQLALSSTSLPENRLFDIGNSFIRTQLSTVAGASLPYPYGGRQRQVQVDIDPAKLRARGLSAADVTNAIGSQNLILPAGTQKIGSDEYFVRLNASPKRIAQLNDLPIRVVNGAMVYVRDVAYVHDGGAPQTNIVRVNGRRAVLMSVLKTGNASTLSVIDQIKAKLPEIRAGLPAGLHIKALGDQSLFVRASISGVVREALIAAALTGLMILLFLGSFRSTLIITISIPLSILSSIIVLSALGETINIMTLGGLALAVGILVDDATVTIENINWHLEQGQDVETAILAGAQQIALPALVSTLAICIVFVPMFFLSGVSRYLFTPLAEAVVFAMLASYLLSRTLVPTLAKYWLHVHAVRQAQQASGNVLQRFQHGFEQRFERLRGRYRQSLETVVAHRGGFVLLFFAGCLGSIALLAPWLGRDFFPNVDTGQMDLHLRAPIGTRIERTAALCDHVEALVRQVIPRRDLADITDNIGVPYSGINLTYSSTGVIGPGDADILISLKPGHRPTADYMRRLRQRLPSAFPGTDFAFLPADIVSKILNFGMPAPLDVQISGYDQPGNLAYANALLTQFRHVPGAVDLRIQQAFNYPELKVHVDRSKAALLGLTQSDIATNLLVSLSGSFQTSPTFWVDPRTGVQYSIATQTPQYRLTSLQALLNTPLTTGKGGAAHLLGDIATVRRGFGPAVVTHYNAKPTLDLYGGVQGTDLGSVATRVRAVVAQTPGLPKGSQVKVRGQIQTMYSAYVQMLGGLAFAILLVYLLIVVNFQSWTDPFIVIAALPAALAGIVWLLFLTWTPLSVPALTGAIMCMGVATANSILVISFARERMADGDSPLEAALAAGYTRFRPVLMTALAMIIGMVPMALGLGEGGEQNAPLGRAVIGGLLLATGATLFFVPTFFALIHERRRRADAA